MRSWGKLLFATIAAAATLSIAQTHAQETPPQERDPNQAKPTTQAQPHAQAPSPETARIYASARPYMNDPPRTLKSELGDLYAVKFDPDQAALPGILESVSVAITAQLPRVPNLIAREDVAIEQPTATYYVSNRRMSVRDLPITTDGTLIPQNWKHFEYLILAQHLPGDGGVVFDESRHEIGTRSDTAATPRGTGFGSVWLLFLSGNLAQSHFRYLGKETIHRHHTSVIAFAQDPARVIDPGVIQLASGRTPLLYQGIAWVDDETSRILRIRTDLLAPLPAINLQQVTSIVSFSEVKIPQFETPLWLPRKVEISWNLGGTRLGEIHQYSAYHLFRATSRILPN